MASLLIGLMIIALIVVAALALEDASLSSASEISASWDHMTGRTGDRARTELTLITADVGGGGSNIDISLRNTGQTALADFSRWDVVLQYFEKPNNRDMRVLWLPYTTYDDHSIGQWTVRGLYLVVDSVPEVYEPNVFNPGEEMLVRLSLTPAIPANTDNIVTVGVSNGVTMAAPVSI